jgi:methylenetetrahydrofolate dehydrogenase (NADP+)/methenyltetrahydrofolate cyclohydrolase
MSAKILEGPVVAEALNSQMSAKIEELKGKGVTPCLGILRVGERPDDISYEKGATKRAESVGLAVKKMLLPETVTTEELVAKIEEINADESIHGLLMFRPLPKHIDEKLVCETLDPAKDIDSCTEASLAGVFTGSGVGFAPCTAQACIEILDHYDIECQGKRAVVIGRSLVIGKPVAMMLLAKNATVTIAHSRTQNLAEVAKDADIIIACVGRAHMVDGTYVAPGQTVIDVGINFIDGKLTGDVDFDAAVEVVDQITPVPKGVGSVTTSVLCKHVVEAAAATL